MADAAEVFRSIDTSNDEYVNLAELRYGLDKMGMGLTLSQARQVFRAFDADGNSRIDRHEFESLVGYIKETVEGTAPGNSPRGAEVDVGIGIGERVGLPPSLYPPLLYIPPLSLFLPLLYISSKQTAF